MSTALTISEVGLRLIKAYEGYRPVDIELVSGQRVAGYGHRVMSGESLHLSQKKAEKLLKRDLAPYEAMINDSIFAPLTQSQFDALCSLAFNIGPKKFLASDVVRALNNGRILDAANGFDVWRKGQINGESYVVDALVRRRTAEKVLFLRPSLSAVRAPRVDLETVADTDIAGMTTVFSTPLLEDSGLVPTLNYAAAQTEPDVQTEEDFTERRDPESPVPATATPMRRRDDRPGGVLTHSEVFDDEPSQQFGAPDACDPLFKDIKGFVLDIYADEVSADTAAIEVEEEPLTLNDIAEYDDGAFADEDITQKIRANRLAEYTDVDELDNDGFDPSDYIVGEQGGPANDDDILELIDIEETPSPIAAAAAEVSGRLDALMAKRDVNAPDMDKNVLPFRAKKASALSSNEAKKLTQESLVYGSLLQSEKEVAADDKSTARGIGKGNDKMDIAAQKDSADRYIANNIAPRHKKPANIGLNFMVIGGMILLAVSVATMLSGFDKQFGVGGEFLSTAGALLGLMITLGSIYYVIKNIQRKA